MNYYKHHIGDYDSHTAHLTWLEDAAYRRLLCLYYRKEQAIPVEIDQACRLVRAVSKAEREAVATVLREFFELTDGGWVNKRCDTEIEAYQAKEQANRKNGSKGGRPKKTETDEKPTGLFLGSEEKPTNNLNQEPLTKNQEPKNKTPLSGKPDQMAEVREVLTFLRNMTGRAYREAPPTVNLIKSRLKNTSVDDIKRVLVHKGQQWLDDPEMEQFLRPSTLFRPSNFEQYLAEALANA